MQNSDFRQTLDYMYSKLPMFTRIGAAAYKKDLKNTLALCEALGNPQQKFKSIHIAGTNGKGSVSHMLASILQCAGYKTGLYTSPHLLDFRERIRVDGQMVPEQFVIDFIEKLKPLIEEIEPSFFELTVAMAFMYFAEAGVDFAIIETGLGGRLDSTNIVTPELSIITNISFDHQNMLGNTLGEIAAEKAGIIKQNIPVIIGQHNPETDPVFNQKAAEQNSPIYYAPEKYLVQESSYENGFQQIKYKAFSGEVIYVKTPLGGNYQQANIATVLTAADILKSKFSLPQKAVLHGIEEVKQRTGLRGRWEILQPKPLTICDVAHNEAGLKAVFQQINSIPHQKLHLVYGMVKDKDVELALGRLPKNAQYYFCAPQIPRALPVDELFTAATNAGLHGSHYPTVADALANARSSAQQNDIVLCTGSIFVVAEALAAAG